MLYFETAGREISPLLTIAKVLDQSNLSKSIGERSYSSPQSKIWILNKKQGSIRLLFLTKTPALLNCLIWAGHFRQIVVSYYSVSWRDGKSSRTFFNWIIPPISLAMYKKKSMFVNVSYVTGFLFISLLRFAFLLFYFLQDLTVLFLLIFLLFITSLYKQTNTDKANTMDIKKAESSQGKYRLSIQACSDSVVMGKLQTFKIVKDYRDIFRLWRQLLIAKTVTNFQTHSFLCNEGMMCNTVHSQLLKRIILKFNYFSIALLTMCLS